jgi:hypothetical protein
MSPSVHLHDDGVGALGKACEVIDEAEGVPCSAGVDHQVCAGGD